MFLGSTSIQPGRFNPIGTLIAVYFLVTGITGLQLLGVQTFVQHLFDIVGVADNDNESRASPVYHEDSI